MKFTVQLAILHALALEPRMECDKWSVESSWLFRDKQYIVSADVREDLLVVQVEELVTADRWKGQFEPKRKPWPMAMCVIFCYCRHLYCMGQLYAAWCNRVWILNDCAAALHAELPHLCHPGQFYYFC